MLIVFFLPPITLSPTETFFPKLIFKFSFTCIHTYKLLFFLFELHRCYTMYFYFRLFFFFATESHYSHTPPCQLIWYSELNPRLHARSSSILPTERQPQPRLLLWENKVYRVIWLWVLDPAKSHKDSKWLRQDLSPGQKVVFLILLLPIKCAWELSFLLSRLSPGTCAHLFTSPPLFSYLLLIPRAHTLARPLPFSFQFSY